MELKNTKIRSLSSLKNTVKKLKSKGKTIGLSNGIFDLLHAGHIRYLKEAKKRVDILIVALNSDRSTEMLKGKGRPVLNEKDRAYILSKIKYVDYIVVFDEVNVEKVLKELKPHYHIKGGDYREDTIPERKVADALGIKPLITGGNKINSTSSIIKKIVEIYSL